MVINLEILGAAIGILAFSVAAVAQSPIPTGKPSSYPAWWFERDAIERTSAASSPMWPDDYPSADDYGTLIQGQLKAIGSKAYAEMQSELPDSIWSTTEGEALEDMVTGWLADTTAGDNYALINSGQLKTVAIKFYDVLNEAGYEPGLNLPPTTWASGTYPWTASTLDDDNYAIALLGQTKNLFSFDLKRSNDGDGLADWWENANGLDVTASDQNNNGLQDQLDDFDGDGIINGIERTDETHPLNSGSATSPPGTEVDTTGENGLQVYTPIQ